MDIPVQSFAKVLRVGGKTRAGRGGGEEAPLRVFGADNLGEAGDERVGRVNRSANALFSAIQSALQLVAAAPAEQTIRGAAVGRYTIAPPRIGRRCFPGLLGASCRSQRRRGGTPATPADPIRRTCGRSILFRGRPRPIRGGYCSPCRGIFPDGAIQRFTASAKLGSRGVQLKPCRNRGVPLTAQIQGSASGGASWQGIQSMRLNPTAFQRSWTRPSGRVGQRQVIKRLAALARSAARFGPAARGW